MPKPAKQVIPQERIKTAIELMDDLAPFFASLVTSEVLNGLRTSGKLTDVQAVVADIGQYYSLVKRSGVDPRMLDELQERFSSEPTVRVPVFYLEALLKPFADCLHGSARLTLGQAFGLEGKGQGARNRLKKLELLVRDLRLCDQVLGLRLHHEAIEQPISLESAYAKLAEQLALHGQRTSTDTIKRAYRRFRKPLQEAAKVVADRVHHLGMSRPR